MRVSRSALLFVLLASACSRTDVFAGPEATIEVAPATARLELGRSLQFAATTIPENLAVRWTLDPADAGSLSASGLYTAPDRLPDGAASLDVTIRGTVLSVPTATATALVKVIPATSGPPVRLVAVSGDGQVVPAGTPAPESLVVRAVDAQSNAVGGVKVTFEADGQPGLEAVTDASGLASASVTVSRRAGPMLITASANGLESVAFGLQVVPGPLAALTASHPSKRGHPGAPVPEPVTLRFTDSFGNPLAAQTASAQPPAGAAAVPLAAASDADGVLKFSLSLAPSASTQTFLFFATDDRSITAQLDMAAIGGAAARMVALDGDLQEGIVDLPLAKALRVQLLDADGYPASAAAISWSTPDGGRLEGATTTPDDSGIVSTNFVLPTRSGLARVVCAAESVAGSPLTFIAKARAAAAQRLQLVAGGGQSATAGGPFGGAFSVRATDAFSNAVPGVTVQFEAISGGGSISPASVETGFDGLAQALMTAGGAGAQRYRATAAGLVGSPIEITATAVAPSPALLSIVSGQGQTGVVGTDLVQALVVRVTQNGAPVAGQTISFAVALGDGTVRPATSVTAGDGTARTTARLGSTPGAQRFSASLPGATNSPAFFDATAAPRPPSLLRLVSGGGQTAPAGSVLAAPFVVEALDVTGAAVAGVTIHFSAPPGAVVSPADATTDASGRASSLATLATVDGDQVFGAVVVGVPSAAVTIHATAGGAVNGRTLRISAGNAQSAEVGLSLAQPLEVILTEAGVPVPGAEIRFRAEAELATVSETTATTDASGRARVIARLGKTVGTQRFIAETDNATGSPAAFSETALPAPADRLVVASGDGQSARTGTPLPRPLVARATDRVGNAKSGVVVTFRAGAGAGSCAPTSVTTDANGEVATTATLGAAAGPQTFVADGPGLVPATFTALATNPVDRISVAPKALVLEPGASVRYVATAIYSDGTNSEVTADATWASSNTAALAVSDTSGSKGVGLAGAAGTATVSATFGGKTGSTTATVQAATLRTIVILPATPTLTTGSTRQFRATGTYSNGEVVDVTESATWTSSATNVAAVSDVAGSKGLVRGVGLGTATISAVVSGVTGTRVATIVQAPLRQLEVTPPDVTQPAGTGFVFRATATYEDGTVEDVTRTATWSSSDTNLMTVQNAPAEAGRATFLAQGTPSVRATWLGVTASRPVTITAATVLSLAAFPRQVSLSVHDIFQVRLVATYSDGTVSDVGELATWASFAPNVADVSNAALSRGQITAIGAGTATITAQLGTVTATVTVNVNNAQVRGILVEGGGGRQGPSCPKGGVLVLRAFALYSNGQRAEISDQASWSVADPSLAVVGQGPQLGGVVQCLAEGQTTITAEFAGRSGNITITVTPAELTSISIAPPSAQLAAGDVRAFFATGRYSDGTVRELTNLATWDSSDLSVLTVSNAAQNKGRASALAPGNATVSATFQGITGTASVTVTNATLSLIVVTPTNPVVRPPGGPGGRDRVVQFNATAVYSDGNMQDITEQASWTASDPQVALVSNDPRNIGTVVIQGSGTCVVTASYAGKKGQTTLTVR